MWSVHYLLPSLGVHHVQVALLTNRADITYKPGLTSPDSLVSDINSLGFRAEVLSEGEGPDHGCVNLEVICLWQKDTQ